MKNRRKLDGCWNCKHCAILFGVSGGICAVDEEEMEPEDKEVLFYEICDVWQRRPEGRDIE
jgi:hypothetical protein